MILSLYSIIFYRSGSGRSGWRRRGRVRKRRSRWRSTTGQCLRCTPVCRALCSTRKAAYPSKCPPTILTSGSPGGTSICGGMPRRWTVRPPCSTIQCCTGRSTPTTTLYQTRTGVSCTTTRREYQSETCLLYPTLIDTDTWILM